MKFRNILNGKTAQAQESLNAFFANIRREKILWYPSAGFDYRDLLEMTRENRTRHGISQAPNIICHTDYCYSWTKLENIEDDILYSDSQMTVKLIEKIPLDIAPEVGFQYIVDPNYVDFPQNAPEKPTVFLLNLEVTSVELGTFSASVFFFVLENYNFLQEILLKHKIHISHFVKICEGCGFGGNRNSITVFYSLLGNLSVKYLLVDNEIHYNRTTHDEIAARYNICHKNFELEMLNTLPSWSDFSAKIFKVVPRPGNLTQDGLDKILMEISGRSDVDYI
jgi:hypothetical protein